MKIYNIGSVILADLLGKDQSRAETGCLFEQESFPPSSSPAHISPLSKKVLRYLTKKDKQDN